MMQANDDTNQKWRLSEFKKLYIWTIETPDTKQKWVEKHH